MFEFINGKGFETGKDLLLHVHNSLGARNLARVLCFVPIDLLESLVNTQPQVNDSSANQCHIFLRRQRVRQEYAMRVRRERGLRKLPSHF